MCEGLWMVAVVALLGLVGVIALLLGVAVLLAVVGVVRELPKKVGEMEQIARWKKKMGWRRVVHRLSQERGAFEDEGGEGR